MTVPYAVGHPIAVNIFNVDRKAMPRWVLKTLSSRFSEYEQNATRISFVHPNALVVNNLKKKKPKKNSIESQRP